jgi:hypothetical protein
MARSVIEFPGGGRRKMWMVAKGVEGFALRGNANRVRCKVAARGAWNLVRITVLALSGLVACGGGPQVRATPDYVPKALVGHRVVLVSLAMSDDLGDQRTGIVLSGETRRLASANACSTLAKGSHERSVVCPESATSKVLGEIQKKFALDEPVSVELWSALREELHADYALLFRPESVASTNEVKTKYASSEERQEERVGRTIAGALAFGILGAMVRSQATVEKETTSDTELTYTLSAVLVDTRTIKVLKVGLHSGSDSKTVRRNLGYAEAPPSAPILEKIMVGLGDKMLAD